jgi:hypothetical protein
LFFFWQKKSNKIKFVWLKPNNLAFD